MENIAVHMRIASVSVSDDDVNSRRTAATNLATAWGKESSVSKILSKAADAAVALNGDGKPSAALGEEVQKAIQKKSASYLYEERPLDVSVCAGMAMISILGATPGTRGYSSVDFYAAALWSVLAYQPVLEADRREKLRREVLDAAIKWSTTSAEAARERADVPDPSIVNIAIGEDGLPTHNIADALAKTIEALRRNAALDREELDFLWWAQLGRSRLLNRQLSAIAEPTRIVAAGIEGARMLRRLPCEVHREIVLRTLDQNTEIDLPELLAAIGDDRELLGAAFIEGSVASYPAVFPFLHALATGEANGAGATVKRPVSEWGERALLEAGFAKLISHGPAKL
ncbi:GTPase-associated system all-helical protein GASH [Pseudomonas sp. 10C3]|uniref:GTPase-associated system all-helical protein GASH n=1 Tax=Pseudomonas sp. 10C3 TaxID=3118753 RepID=UPI002E80E60D|nr:GTPase-associated system all-helical protein GASH [Pseudomonas sp. 10C3]MEE3508531.1 GTPase-associated system all-helical protein GASH [Pseudomonas sp. 10C3]